MQTIRVGVDESNTVGSISRVGVLLGKEAGWQQLF